MSMIRNGHQEGVPYSLSRWTDVPVAKWDWFKGSLAEGHMFAIDPRTGVPWRWSLKPKDTLGLVFWTKDPRNLLADRALLMPYENVKVHVTVTGWEEVEKGAPDINTGARLLVETARQFGCQNVTWRFSPVPLVDDVIARFEAIAVRAEQVGISSVYLSFLQQNDRLPETRDSADRLSLLVGIAERAERHGMRVLLCNEDRLLARVSELPVNLGSGVCAAPEDFGRPGYGLPPSEGCGCVLMADPFTINESCALGCSYCYASDKSLADKKRNTTKRHLPTLK